MTSITQKTHYEILGIERAADLGAIKAAYKEKLLSTHPDKTKETVEGDIINRIKVAYNVLSDLDSREKYDIEISERFKKNGMLSTGEGLDVFTLDDFKFEETDDVCTFTRDCPRCTSQDGFVLNDVDLEESGTSDGMGGFEILVQCGFCSLWLKVKYFDLLGDEV